MIRTVLFLMVGMLFANVGWTGEKLPYRFDSRSIYLVRLGATNDNGLLGHVGVIAENQYWSFINAPVSYVLERLKASEADCEKFLRDTVDPLRKQGLKPRFLLLEHRKLSFLAKTLTYSNRDLTIVEFRFPKELHQQFIKTLNTEFARQRKDLIIPQYSAMEYNCIWGIQEAFNNAFGKGLKKKINLTEISPGRAKNELIKIFKPYLQRIIFFPSLETARRLAHKDGHPITWYLEYFSITNQTKGKTIEPCWRLVYTEELSGIGTVLRPLAVPFNLATGLVETTAGIVTFNKNHIKKGARGMATSLGDLILLPMNYSTYDNETLTTLNETDSDYITQTLESFSE